MAYVNSSNTAHVSFSDRFAALVKVLAAANARRKLYNRTVFELQALSDRELADLGVGRSHIPEVARAAAYPA